MNILIRANQNYLNALAEIDKLANELRDRQINTSSHFEAAYKKAQTEVKKASLFFILGLIVVLIIIAFIYEYFGNIYINIFAIILGFILVVLYLAYHKELRKEKKTKKEWDAEFKLDEKLTDKIKATKQEAASLALNIIVLSENYYEITNITKKEERAKYFKLLSSEYIDAINYINKQKATYYDYLAYYNSWEAKNTKE